MSARRPPPALRRLMSPHAASPRRLLVVCGFVAVILVLGALGALP